MMITKYVFTILRLPNIIPTQTGMIRFNGLQLMTRGGLLNDDKLTGIAYKPKPIHNIPGEALTKLSHLDIPALAFSKIKNGTNVNIMKGIIMHVI